MNNQENSTLQMYSIIQQQLTSGNKTLIISVISNVFHFLNASKGPLDLSCVLQSDRKLCVPVYLFLVLVIDFPGQKSRYGEQNSLCKLLEAIHSWHYISLGICNCQFLTSARAETSYAAKYLSAHKQFSQQKIFLKAQKFHLAGQQLPHNSLQTLLNIRQKLS